MMSGGRLSCLLFCVFECVKFATEVLNLQNRDGMVPQLVPQMVPQDGKKGYAD